MLLEAGVPLNHIDPWGNTPIDKAILYQNVELIEYMISLNPHLNSERFDMWKGKIIKERFPFTTWILKNYNEI